MYNGFLPVLVCVGVWVCGQRGVSMDQERGRRYYLSLDI